MRTNGFILIALGFTAVAMAGPAGYLPSLGPVALRFAPEPKPRPALILPALLPPTPESSEPKPPEETTEAATEVVTQPPPSQDLPPTLPPIELLPVPATNQTEVLIGPIMDSGQVISPQMFLRYFTPLPGGGARETVVVPPTGFNPAQPPASSSTATYEKIKP